MFREIAELKRLELQSSPSAPSAATTPSMSSSLPAVSLTRPPPTPPMMGMELIGSEVLHRHMTDEVHAVDE
jgi:hypothetical protein